MTEIYELIDQFITQLEYKPPGIQIRYQYLDDTDVNTLGISLYEGPNGIPYVSGGYAEHKVGIHLQYSVSDNRKESLKAMDFMSKLVKDLENAHLAGSEVTILLLEHLGTEAIPLGLNKNGIGQVVSNLLCHYNNVA